jgi:hypothetical protein
MRRNGYRNWIYILIIGVVGIFSPNKLDAQTWVTTDYWDYFYGNGSLRYDTANVGPLQMRLAADGSIYMLVQDDINRKGRLLKIDSTGQILQQTNAFQSGTSSDETAGSLYVLKNNGVVYNVNHRASLVNDYSKTVKTGSHPWTKTSFFPQLVKDVVPTCYNTFILDYIPLSPSASDSVVEVDSAGSFIQFRFLENTRINCLQDSDLIVFAEDKITKQDFNGNIRWTYNDSSLVPISSDTANIFCFYGDTVFKIRTKTGNLVWSKYIPNTYYYSWSLPMQDFGIAILKDSGLVCANGFQLSRYDSSGNLIWTKTDSFPSFGYKALIEDAGGYLITGGASPCINACYSLINTSYVYFITRLDSNGNGVLDSTDHYFSGNANDNSLVGFPDDAAYVGAALGNSGLPIPPVLQQYTQYSVSVFGPDWLGRFSNGLNYKFCDADGNGIIDTNDLHTLAYWGTNSGHQVYPHWRKSSINSNADLHIDIDQDTLMPGDTMRVYLYLDSSTSVDSIYSMSMSMMFMNLQLDSGSSVVSQVNNFGNPGVDLFTYSISNQLSDMQYVISRMNHQNSSLLGDTLAIFRFIVSSGINGNQLPTFLFHAITNGGYDVPFNVISDSVYFFDPNTAINEHKEILFSIVPNPGVGIFSLISKESPDEITVLNLEGEIILKANSSVSSIDLTGNPDGIYLVQVKKGDQIVRKRLTLIH